MTAGSAEVAAVGWAAGLKNKDKSDNYPNSLTILGGKIPGGFYNASYTKPTLVQRINGPVPYYLVQMRGNVAGSAQTFYAAVLDDGNIVRPVPVSRYAYHPVRRSREKWGGAEEKRNGALRGEEKVGCSGEKKNGNRVVEFSEKLQAAEGWAVLFEEKMGRFRREDFELQEMIATLAVSEERWRRPSLFLESLP